MVLVKLSNRLAESDAMMLDSHAAGGEAREDVGLRILAGGDENFGVTHVFVLQRANVAPVAVEQKELRIGDGGGDGVEL